MNNIYSMLILLDSGSLNEIKPLTIKSKLIDNNGM